MAARHPGVRPAARWASAGERLSCTTMTVSRLRPYATTVFAEMSALAGRVGAVNLGQGFPDEDGPPAMLRGGPGRHRRPGVNQYPPGIGVPALRQAIAAQRQAQAPTAIELRPRRPRCW